MIKNKTVLEVKIGDRNYELILENDAPLGEVFDVITQMQSFVVDRINSQVKINKEEEKEDEKIHAI